ncbi:MAG TPA: cell division protein FtsQ/DivIB [Candidatus Saccharimonadia bacterium]
MPLKPPKRRGGVRVPQLSRQVWRGIGLLAGLGVLAWSVTAFFAISIITVKAASGGERIAAETRQVVGSVWWRANVLLVDTDAIKTRLLQVDPTLKSVEISRTLPHTLYVAAILKQPSVAWLSGNQLYVLDADGTVIASNPADNSLPVVVDGSNVPVRVGERAASRRFVDFVSQLLPALAARGVQATKLSIAETTLDLTVDTNKGYRLVFDTGREVPDEFVDYDAVMRTIAAQKKVVAEYVDLRIAGKAYYK